MLDSLPLIWQYVAIGVIAFVVTVIGLWLYNRREKRRKHAIELANLMNRWGLEWFAEAYQMYAVGDYSGLVHKIKEIVQAVRSDEAMVAKLGDVALKVAGFYAKNDPAKASELMGVLQGGPRTPTAAT